MRATIYQLSIPMQCAFGHAEMERSVAESVVFSIEYEGLIGIGEGAPREYVTGETVDSVINVLTQLNISKVVSLLDFSDLKRAVDSASKVVELFQDNKAVCLNARCAVETALLDLIGKYFKCSVSDIISTQLLISTIKPQFLPTTQVLDFSLSAGDFLENRGPFYYVKIKVGTDLLKNFSRVNAIRMALGDKIPISVDVNMAWSLEQAIDMIQALSPLNIAYYEEPLVKGSLKECRELRSVTGAKILLDESLCSIADANMAIKNNACDAFNIRVAKCGGLINAIEIIKLTRKYQLDFQLGAQVAEAGPLIAANWHLASAVSGYFAFEGGQPDRFFNHKDYIVTPMPEVNRSTNLAHTIKGFGLGVSLTKKIDELSANIISWENGRWQSLKNANTNL
ncbi:MAG: hypothetical protein KAT71_01575 [Gammaproteobacteria bacterium]|nr:hypothetical protein [Gammaproteobacteria bacterium]